MHDGSLQPPMPRPGVPSAATNTCLAIDATVDFEQTLSTAVRDHLEEHADTDPPPTVLRQESPPRRVLPDRLSGTLAGPGCAGNAMPTGVATVRLSGLSMVEQPI